MELAQVYDALTPLRAPLQRGEYDLHRMVREAPDERGASRRP